MKKNYILLIIVLFLFMFVPIVEAANKAKVYMFSKDGCSACMSAHEYLDGLLKENKDLFELVEIEVFNHNGAVENKGAYDLMIAVLEHYNENTETLYTPTIVIGDYHNIGFPRDETDLYNAIMELNNSEEDIDVVKDLAKEKNININDVKIDVNKENAYDAYIIIGIFIVLIGGFAGLVFLGKK